jgi:hypothetical protein
MSDKEKWGGPRLYQTRCLQLRAAADKMQALSEELRGLGQEGVAYQLWLWRGVVDLAADEAGVEAFNREGWQEALR